jgi:hypothetical protein
LSSSSATVASAAPDTAPDTAAAVAAISAEQSTTRPRMHEMLTAQQESCLHLAAASGSHELCALLVQEYHMDVFVLDGQSKRILHFIPSAYV